MSPMEETSDSPFKIRNPVQDSRLAVPEDRPRPDSFTVKPPFSPSSTTQHPGEVSEATRNAPFRLRHAVTDPKVSSVRRPSADAAAPPAPPPKDDNTPHSRRPSTAETIANRAMTPIEPPSESEIPPNANVVMPTVVPRRPQHQNQRSRETPSPPEPPPKDDNDDNDGSRRHRSRTTSEVGKETTTTTTVHDRKLSSMSDRKPSGNSFPLGLDRKSASPQQQQQQTSLPRSKFSTETAPQPPLVDELSLEGAGERKDG